MTESNQPAEPTVTKLTPEQLEFVRNCVMKFMLMAEQQVPEPAEDADTAEIGDELLRQWNQNDDPELDEDQMSAVLGCMCGELLRCHMNVSWVWYEDELGSGPALFGQVDGDQVVLHPIDSVAKRMEPGSDSLSEWIGLMLDKPEMQPFLRAEDDEAPSIFEVE